MSCFQRVLDKIRPGWSRGGSCRTTPFKIKQLIHFQIDQKYYKDDLREAVIWVVRHPFLGINCVTSRLTQTGVFY